MTKISKHNEFLVKVRDMIEHEKEASQKDAAQKATGIPGKDTHFERVSDETEHTNKNKVGPEKNEPQEFGQKPQKDESTPTKTTKKSEEQDPAATESKEASAPVVPVAAPVASSGPTDAPVAPGAPKSASVNNKVASLAEELLAIVQKFAEQSATGVPGDDTKYTRVSDETEHTDKNKVGPEKNEPQEFGQKPSGDSSEPSKAKSGSAEVSEEEVDKIASFVWGREVCRAALEKAALDQVEFYKEAGRRDFESLISTAAQQLEEEKKAEAAGVQTFNKVQAEKKAEEAKVAANAVTEKKAEENKLAAIEKKAEELINVKLAEVSKLQAEIAKTAEALKAREAELARKEAEEKEAQKMAAWASAISNSCVETILSRLKNETVRE